MTKELRNRILTIALAADPSLAEAIRHDAEMQEARRELAHSEGCFDDLCSEYSDDVTGQDGDADRYWEGARNLIDARDQYLRRTDPDRYSEMLRGA